MLTTARKKRVLPQWMLSPGKEGESERKSSEKRKSIKDFFEPQKKAVKNSLNFDVFDFDIKGSENESDEKTVSDDKYGDDKLTVYIMSPAELEEIARLVLDQN